MMDCIPNDFNWMSCTTIALFPANSTDWDAAGKWWLDKVQTQFETVILVNTGRYKNNFQATNSNSN